MNKLEKIRAMIRLALVDNRFEESEKAFIKELAELHEITSEELESLMKEELENKDNAEPISLQLDFEGKLEILADLVRIMKVDGKVYLSEIRFCEMMAKMFGFNEKSIGFLSEMVHQDKSVPSNWGRIQHKMRDYVS